MPCVTITVPAKLTPVGYEQLSNLGTVSTLTVPAGAKLAVIQAETSSVRYRDDNVSPTGGTGMRLVVDTEMQYVGNLSALRFIQEALLAKLNVAYYA